MKVVEATYNSPLQLVTDDGTIYGQLRGSVDRKLHFCKYVPYHTPPREAACGRYAGIFTAGSHLDANGNVCAERCADCLWELLMLRS